jgi:antitoxin HicB
MNLAYPYTTKPQTNGSLLVQFVDFEEAFTEGATLEEAAFNASEVLTGIIAHRLEQGEAIPLPSLTKKMYLASPSAGVQAAVLLRAARGDRPLADLARALETSWAAAQRLEDPRHWPSLKQLDRAARVLGKRLVLSFE